MPLHSAISACSCQCGAKKPGSFGFSGQPWRHILIKGPGGQETTLLYFKEVDLDSSSLGSIPAAKDFFFFTEKNAIFEISLYGDVIGAELASYVTALKTMFSVLTAR